MHWSQIKTSLLTLSFFTYTIALPLHKILARLFESRAIVIQESYAVLMFWHVYKVLPAALALSGLGMVVAAAAKKTKGKTLLLWSTIGCCFISLWRPEALYPGLLMFVGYLMHQEQLAAMEFPGLPRRISFPFILHFFLLFSATIPLCSLLESLFQVLPFGDKTFPMTAFLQYLGFTGSLSIAFALTITIIFYLLIQTLLLGLAWAQKYQGMSSGTAMFLLVLFHAGILGYLAHDLIDIAFGDEISALGLALYIPLLFFSPLILLCLLTWHILCAMTAHRKNGDMVPGDIYGQVVQALGLSLFFPLARSENRTLQLAAASFTYLAAAMVLVYLNYPVISDYSASFCLFLSFFVILCAASILFLICRHFCFSLPPPAAIGVAMLLLIYIPIGSRLYSYQNVRMMVFEYSKISWAELQLLSYLPLHKKAGFGEDTTFAYYPEVYRTFTALPLPVERPPIFMLLLDALRPDHTNLMDYPRELTPNLKKIAAEGVFFRNAHSCATGTTCSLRHIFSGRYSSRFMLEKEKIDPFWIEDLIDAGYSTFVVNTFQSDYNGISKEAFYRNIPPQKFADVTFIEIKSYDEFPKVEEALERLKQIVHDPARPLSSGIFTYLHCCRPHIPWMPTNPIFGDDEVARYDAAIKEADQALGIFFNGVKELGLYENAIIIILADHGTGLMEHGRFGGFLTYEEQVRIPLVVRMPGCSPRISDVWAQTIDIGPTLLNAVSNVKTNRFHGISLLPILRGKELPADRLYTFSLSSFEDLVAVTEARRYKFHYHRRYGYYQLYDLAEDPGETNNIADDYPEQVKHYLSVLDNFLRAGNATYNNPYHYYSFDPEDFR